MPQLTAPADVLALASQLGEPKPMRRGSVTERYVKCNKMGCSCGEHADARHGPYISVSRVVKGKTQSRWLNAEQAKVVREQVESGQQFRQHVEEYWQACEQWADAQLVEPTAASEVGAAKKGGSKRCSTPARRGLCASAEAGASATAAARPPPRRLPPPSRRTRHLTILDVRPSSDMLGHDG